MIGVAGRTGTGEELTMFLIWLLTQVHQTIQDVKHTQRAASLAWKVGLGVFRFGVKRKTQEPAKAQGSFRWDAVKDDRPRTHDILVIDDVHRSRPATPEERAKMRRWYEETLKARIGEVRAGGFISGDTLEGVVIKGVKDA
jgi:hypothetical protein